MWNQNTLTFGFEIVKKIKFCCYTLFHTFLFLIKTPIQNTPNSDMSDKISGTKKAKYFKCLYKSFSVNYIFYNNFKALSNFKSLTISDAIEDILIIQIA